MIDLQPSIATIATIPWNNIPGDITRPGNNIMLDCILLPTGEVHLLGNSIGKFASLSPYLEKK